MDEEAAVYRDLCPSSCSPASAAYEFYIKKSAPNLTDQEKEFYSTMEECYSKSCGYRLPENEMYAMANEMYTYGELMREGVLEIIQHTAMGPSDVFYDLGCGVGKVVVQVGIESSVERTIGLEVIPHRVACANTAIANLLNHPHCPVKLQQNGNKRVEIREEDIFKGLWQNDATVVYGCLNCFSSQQIFELLQLISNSPKLTWFVTTADIPEEMVKECHMELKKQVDVPVSWSAPPIALHFYQKATINSL